MDQMELSPRQYDLEAQQKILELAVRLDSQKGEFASRNELMKVGLELGLSEESMSKAFEAFEAGSHKDASAKVKAKSSEKTKMFVLLNVVLACITFLACLITTSYGVVVPATAKYALAGLSVAFLLGLMVGNKPRLLLSSLRNQFYAIVGSLLIIVAWNSLIGYPNRMSGQWLTGVLAYAGAVSALLFIGAKLAHPKAFSLSELLRTILNGEKQPA